MKSVSTYLMAAALAVSVTSASAAVIRQAQRDTGLVRIIGNWSAVDDGGPAIKVDTAGWSGTTDRAALESMAKSLFGAVNDTFVTNGSAPQAFPLAVHTGTKDFTNGTIRVQFKLVGGASDQTAGIVFNLRPNGEYFFARYNTKDGNVAVWRYRNGERARVADGASKLQLPLNAWHELVMTVSGNRLSAAVTGSALGVDHALEEPISGRVGLWTKRDAITVFKRYRVTP